jgi:hypothetical protein
MVSRGEGAETLPLGEIQYGTGSPAAFCSGASEPFAAGSDVSAFEKMEKSIFRRCPATIETAGILSLIAH